MFFCFKQKTAYEMRISDWSSDVCSSDLGKEMVMVGPQMTSGPFGAGVGAGIRKGDPSLAAMFDAAINAAIDDGSLETLAVKWFGFDAAAKKDRKSVV